MRNRRLRRAIDEFDLVKKSFKKAGTRHTAFMISKLRAASNLGRMWKTKMTMPKLCSVSMKNT